MYDSGMMSDVCVGMRDKFTTRSSYTYTPSILYTGQAFLVVIPSFLGLLGSTCWLNIAGIP